MSAERVTFYFENRRLEARSGDTIAKTLFEAGVRTLSYSVKYKRPRGLHCARGRCVMCHMEVDGIPGVPTCITPVADGMRVVRENFRPFFAPFLVSVARRVPFPAGFYYRMFTRPAWVRKLFLGSLRKMAGVGRVRVEPNLEGTNSKPAPAGRTPRAVYDVIVVGAGLSGLSAALEAAKIGGDVLLVDEYGQAGGHALGFHVDEELGAARDDLVAKATAHRAIHYFPRTTAQAFFAPNVLLIGPGGSVSPRHDAGAQSGVTAMHQVRAPSFVFATGAYDTIPLFENNDLPGVFGSRAARLLLDRDGVKIGSRAVVYGTGRPLHNLARYLLHHGVDVTGIVDAAPSTSVDAPLKGVRRFRDAWIAGVRGRDWVSAAAVATPDGRTTIACDLLCVAFPGQGAYELAYQAGFPFEMSGGLPETKIMLPSVRSLQNDHGVSFFVAGELTGETDWRAKMEHGRDAGARAARSRQPTRKE
jgi:sarcosine oxidase subunit alpha